MNSKVLEGLIRILENQVTIKEHFGIIKERRRYSDDEYYRDSLVLEGLEEELAECKAREESKD